MRYQLRCLFEDRKYFFHRKLVCESPQRKSKAKNFHVTFMKDMVWATPIRYSTLKKKIKDQLNREREAVTVATP